MKDSFSYYDILGIPSKASDEDIKHAYLKLAKKYHPDQNPLNKTIAAERFQIILEAYNAIKTREKRATYNQKLRNAAQNDNDKQTGILSGISNWFRPQMNTAKETQK